MTHAAMVHIMEYLLARHGLALEDCRACSGEGFVWDPHERAREDCDRCRGDGVVLLERPGGEPSAEDLSLEDVARVVESNEPPRPSGPSWSPL